METELKTIIVKIDYSDLSEKNDISQQISDAFGPSGLGLIVIKNIPKYVECREKILKAGFEMTKIDENYLKSLEKPETNFSLGYGKAKSYFGDQWESLTSYFYARPTRDSIIHSNQKTKETYTNIWPDEKYVGSEFKTNYTNIGKLITDCQLKLLKHLDKYTKQIYPEIEENFLCNTFSETNDVVSRLIMYLPANQYDSKKYGEDSRDNWCGWHRDFGLLTGLTHAMYYKKNGETVSVKSGLIVKDRQKILHDITFEEDEIIIQAGDISFIVTGGSIISTPHCVKITNDIPDDVYRITFVNFFEPAYEQMIDIPRGFNKEKLYEKDPLGMSYMISKWEEPCTYEKFINNSFSNYYVKN